MCAMHVLGKLETLLNFTIGLITVSDAILTGRQKRSEITVFVWESDGKELFPKSNFTQIVNRNVKISGGR